jgi:outer membrane protein OmpA-like peptidoglycan-associated protein/tetratricopeptide (TPR) repeat protein
MKHLILVCILLFTVMLAEGQTTLSTKSKKAQKSYDDAMKSYNLHYFSQAIDQLNEAVKEDDKFIEAWLSMAEVYMDMKKDEDAIKTYKKCTEINPDFFPGMYINLGELEFINAKYKDALSDYEKYLTYPSISDKSRMFALAGIANCDFSIKAIANPVPFNPKNLGTAINNELDQYWPTISVDEQTFVFTQLVPKDPNNEEVFGNRQEDFYISTFRNNGWEPARFAGAPLNTPDNEGAQTLSADGKEIYFTACNRRDGYGLCDIYYSRWNGQDWTIPQNIGAPVNTKFKETQPSLSPDGHTLYFASNRTGGKGGLDLWQSTLQQDGNWSEPINLGDSINTAGEEQSPFIHPDNQTLYFSSTGLTGLGRFDLFVTRKNNQGKWIKPMNLGYPINTNFSEEGLIVNAKGNTAYYSSTRDGGLGGRDIYQFELYKEVRPKPVSYMKGVVYDAETKRPLRAKFELIDLESAVTVMESFSQSSDGSFLISIPSGKDYALNANTPGYLFFSENFTLLHADYSKPYLVDVPMKPIKSGEKAILRNIFFDTDKFVVKAESRIELNKLLKLLQDNPSLKIQISGHTDNLGSPEYNRVLSENRAKAVVGFLTGKGIDIGRLSAKGFGETQPIATNETEEGRAQNRRTEFLIL